MSWFPERDGFDLTTHSIIFQVTLQISFDHL